MSVKNDIVGKRFGMLVVTEETNKRKNGCVVWKCKCDCGNVIEVQTGSLQSGSTKSCGCQKNSGILKYNANNSVVKVGDIYGLLEVVEKLGYENYYGNKKRMKSLCRCECGNFVEVFDNQLSTLHKTSCGCIKSLGENIITKILIENNIKFDYNKTFEELKNQTGRNLRFDFIIYNENGDLNRFVEFDGNQHKYGMRYGNWSKTETHDVIKERDEVKNNFCINNNYTLIRLPYNTLKSMTIEKIMKDEYRYVGKSQKNE